MSAARRVSCTIFFLMMSVLGTTSASAAPTCGTEPQMPPKPTANVMRDVLNRQLTYRNCLLNGKRREKEAALKFFVDGVTSKVKERKGAVELETRTDAAQLAVVKEILAAQLATAKASLVGAETMLKRFFGRYKKCGDRSPKRLTALAEAASSADLKRLLELRHDIEAIERAEKREATSLTYENLMWSGRLKAMQTEFDGQLAAHEPIMTKHMISRPDHFAAILKALSDASTHATTRAESMQRVTQEAQDRIMRRIEALEALRLIALAQQDIEAARKTLAASGFMQDLTRLTRLVWDTPSVDTRFGLPFLTVTLEAAQRFLDREAECKDGIETAAWRKTGCQLNAGEFEKTKKFLANTLPENVKLNVDLLRGETQDDPYGLYPKIVAALEAKDVRAAVVAYDAYLSSLNAQ